MCTFDLKKNLIVLNARKQKDIKKDTYKYMFGKGVVHRPLIQGLDVHSSISMSQIKPLYPGLHWHCHKLGDDWTQAPFLQGLDKQTSI